MSTKAGGTDDLYYRPRGRRNMYGWQAGGMQPTAMLSYLLIQIGFCDLFC